MIIDLLIFTKFKTSLTERSLMIKQEYQEFIDIIKVTLNIYKMNQSKRYIKDILVRTLRMIESISPLDVSNKAQEKAIEMGIEKPLYYYSWLDQNKSKGMKDYDRSIFHWEHFYPIGQQVKDLLAIEQLTDEEIYNVISKNKVCWILKEENKELERIAKSNRPNPADAYRKANIKLIGEKPRMW